MAVLVGGYAVAFRGRPRATKDIDLLLGDSSENLAAAARALEAFGAPANVVRAAASMKPSEVVFLGQPPLRVDLLRTIDGVATAEVLARAVIAELDGVPIRVIALDDLIADRRSTGRPLDEDDARFLERVRDRRGAWVSASGRLARQSMASLSSHRLWGPPGG